MYGFFLFEILIVASTINTGYCLKCYVCDNKFEPKCVDPFIKKNALPFECSRDKLFRNPEILSVMPMALVPTNEFLCVKINVTVQGFSWLIRSCVSKPETSNFCRKMIDSSKPDRGLVKYCRTCRRDGCNRGGKVKALFVAIILACVVSVLCQFH